MGERTQEELVALRRMILRLMATPIRHRAVEVVQRRMIPDPPEVELGPSPRGETPVSPPRRPRKEGATFLHHHPNRRARRARKK